MTTRVEFRNSHTNSQNIRVREVELLDGGRYRIVDGPAVLEIAPGQNGARRVAAHALLVELAPSSTGKEPVPTETADPAITEG